MFTNVNRPSAVDVLRPFVVGDQFYADTTSTLAKQAIGTTGQVQTVAGGIPAWSFSFKATAITAATSAGILLENSNGDDVALLGAGPGTGATFYGGVVGSTTLSLTQATGTTLTVSSTTDSSSKDTGSLVTEGGIGVEKKLVAGDQVITANSLLSGATSQSLPMASGLFIKQASGDNFDNGICLQRNAALDAYSLVTGADDNFYIGYAPNSSGVNAPGDFSITLRVRQTLGFDVYATTDATSSGTGAIVVSGGGNFAKNVLARQGLAHGVTNVVTAAGTTTLTNASTTVQIATGTTTQTFTLPAANALGAGISQKLIIKNRSTGNVTINRAGSDTIDGGTTITLTGGANESVELQSDGVSEWVIV